MTPDSPRLTLVSERAKEEEMAGTSDVQARPGDEIVIHGHALGDREKTGEILDVLGERGHEHYRVRWEDGHESIHYPGSDAHIKHLGRRGRAQRKA
jgi:Domain of unknown function (DUF1918)